MENKKILIDLIKYRSRHGTPMDEPVPEAIHSPGTNTNGRKPLRELAVFRYSCRRCEDSPCVEVCPEDALRKDKDGIIERSTLKCVACKSCVAACPFGTMMSDFFIHKRKDNLFYNIDDPEELQALVSESPDSCISVISGSDNGDENIHQLTEDILIRDYPWEKLKAL